VAKRVKARRPKHRMMTATVNQASADTDPDLRYQISDLRYQTAEERGT